MIHKRKRCTKIFSFVPSQSHTCIFKHARGRDPLGEDGKNGGVGLDRSGSEWEE